ncbi:unnamed protein product [Auanema sp. JU1783]|nr:unnamed protein product [Auanema sp. JU1783]
MSSLLVASDDSDVPDLDLPPVRRRRFFNNKSKTSSPLCVNISWSNCLFLSSLVLSVLVLAITSYKLTKKFNQLNENLSELIVLPAKISVIEKDIQRLQMEFDLMRESYSIDTSNSTKRSSQYIYDVMETLKGDITDMKTKVDKSWLTSESVSQRISTVEKRCLAVCHTDGLTLRDGEKQRRREADKQRKIVDEVVFKRTAS